jgi:hypothetical protein
VSFLARAARCAELAAPSLELYESYFKETFRQVGYPLLSFANSGPKTVSCVYLIALSAHSIHPAELMSSI